MLRSCAMRDGRLRGWWASTPAGRRHVKARWPNDSLRSPRQVPQQSNLKRPENSQYRARQATQTAGNYSKPQASNRLFPIAEPRTPARLRDDWHGPLRTHEVAVTAKAASGVKTLPIARQCASWNTSRRLPAAYRPYRHSEVTFPTASTPHAPRQCGSAAHQGDRATCGQPARADDPLIYYYVL